MQRRQHAALSICHALAALAVLSLASLACGDSPTVTPVAGDPTSAIPTRVPNPFYETWAMGALRPAMTTMTNDIKAMQSCAQANDVACLCKVQPHNLDATLRALDDANTPLAFDNFRESLRVALLEWPMMGKQLAKFCATRDQGEYFLLNQWVTNVNADLALAQQDWDKAR
jgi:hypothetical protein